MPTWRTAFFLLFLGARSVSAAPLLTQEERRSLVQTFVRANYQKSFRYLGDENDFDHGHFLFAPGAARPSAILYHTQEMAPMYRRLKPGGKYDYVDTEGRNWIQFIDEPSKILNAKEFLKDRYADQPRWRDYRTITDRMLDPEKLGIKIQKSVQWVFKQTDCDKNNADLINIEFPAGRQACLRSEPEQNLYTGAVVESAQGALP